VIKGRGYLNRRKYLDVDLIFILASIISLQVKHMKHN